MISAYDASIQTFAASSQGSPNTSRLQIMNPSEYLHHQLAVQKKLQEELARLKDTAVSSPSSLAK